MKNICKFVSLCLTAVMLLSMLALVACKKNNENNNDTGKDIANYQSNGTNNLGQVYYNKNLFYNNSVIQGGPDPQVLDNTERDGYYYLFITAGILRSTNLTDWEEAGPLFVPETDELKKVLKENVWAPETVYDEDLGKYVMFFSSTAETDTTYAAGKGIVSGRGYCVMHVALSDKPEGPYTLVDFSDANSCGEDNVHTYNTVGGTKLTDEQVASNEYAYVKEGDTYYRAAFPHYFTKYLLFNPEAIYKFLQSYGDITANSRNGKYPQDTIDPHPFVDPKTGNKYLFLLLCNILFLLIGCFMDAMAAMIVIAPLLAPVVRALDINIIHFGLMMCFNVGLAAITPPFGTYIFLVSGLLKMKTSEMIRDLWPFIGVALIVLMLVTYVPWFSTFIPNLMYGSV